MEITFARELLRIYDRKLMGGEITFGRSGITKEDFTNLCTHPDYIIPKDRLLVICDKMNLSPEEREKLFTLSGQEM